ncbi:hypothetical protein CRE_09283 [Caenorhabditis remanei]|uniref:Serpentine receptor class gamma n=1 Tax=Caenorhabditis remanei TaxID=31234 RepID=E3LHY8_CAERE|nr:hypothetical protein CRE_09283 [Caenorhabditis remanei]
MYLFIHTIQHFSFIFSKFTNFLLLYLIWKTARNLLGQFRYLMSTFAVYSIVYNYVNIITHPLVLIEKQMYVVFVGLGNLNEYESILCMFGASFGLCISLLCTEFIFRYIIICQ